MDIKEIKRIKRDSKLVYELTKMVEELTEELNRQDTTLRKEKQYYMDEYKKVSDTLRDMRRQKEKQGENKSTLIKCKDKCCFHNNDGVCQSDIIDVDTESVCLLAERNPMCDC